MAKPSGQDAVGKNRPPRVHIKYEVETGGARVETTLPFVVGVMADFSGSPKTPLPSVNERKYLEISVDNFDDRMKAVQPRVAFTVPNTLTGEGNLPVDLTFESIDDFSPGNVAKKVDPLSKLLQARKQLDDLLSYVDGKPGAEELLAKLLHDPALLKALGSRPVASDETPAPTGPSDNEG